MLSRYGTLYKLLCNVYSEYEWLPWKFKRQQEGMWDDSKKKEFADWAGKMLGIKEMSDWYKVSSRVYCEGELV